MATHHHQTDMAVFRPISAMLDTVGILDLVIFLKAA
jgi:hypothetical protein